MFSTKLASIGLAASLAAILPAASAQAQAPRTFVSAAGSDSNPCSFAAPCRHFQAAVNATSAGGEVDALDPAGYGPITITQGITIEGQGWSYIAPPANGNGITINAVSGNVSIHGVSLNGAGITGGTNGIVFNAGASLTVTDCVAQHFNGSSATTGNGILIQPTSGSINFVVTNTNVSGNGNVGLYYLPTSGGAVANGVIDHVEATNNQFGIVLDNSGGGAALVAVSNGIASNNVLDGIDIGAATNPLVVSIDNTGATSNLHSGFSAGGANASVLIGRSVISANARGIIISGATVYSYQNNQINLNSSGIDITGGSLNTTFALR
jgi:hypothetical protein